MLSGIVEAVVVSEGKICKQQQVPSAVHTDSGRAHGVSFDYRSLALQQTFSLVQENK